ncbi:hypothetical protein Tco_0817017 [Tanacetum coccineum]
MLTKPRFFYDHTTKQALGFQNSFYLKKAQQLELKLYDRNAIKDTSAIVIPDSEETLMLAEESRHIHMVRSIFNVDDVTGSKNVLSSNGTGCGIQHRF